MAAHLIGQHRISELHHHRHRLHWTVYLRVRRHGRKGAQIVRTDGRGNAVIPKNGKLVLIRPPARRFGSGLYGASAAGWFELFTKAAHLTGLGLGAAIAGQIVLFEVWPRFRR